MLHVSFWHVHDQPLLRLLADAACTRILHGYRSWLPLHANSRRHCYKLYEKKRACNGHRKFWKHYRQVELANVNPSAQRISGGIIYPVIFNKLVGRLGFGWTSRVIAFIMLFLCALPVLGLRMRTKPPAVRRIFDSTAWRDPGFSLFAVALFIGYIGMYIPYFYIQLYCVEQGIITGSLNFYLLPIINATGFFGRVVSCNLEKPPDLATDLTADFWGPC